ncbi:MAG TPA: hypothetical protein V6C65_17965, partial [Allocoleopsis sp.]
KGSISASIIFANRIEYFPNINEASQTYFYPETPFNEEDSRISLSSYFSIPPEADLACSNKYRNYRFVNMESEKIAVSSSSDLNQFKVNSGLGDFQVLTLSNQENECNQIKSQFVRANIKSLEDESVLILVAAPYTY